MNDYEQTLIEGLKAHRCSKQTRHDAAEAIASLLGTVDAQRGLLEQERRANDSLRTELQRVAAQTDEHALKIADAIRVLSAPPRSTPIPAMPGQPSRLMRLLDIG